MYVVRPHFDVTLMFAEIYIIACNEFDALVKNLDFGNFDVIEYYNDADIVLMLYDIIH
jgi:hypothetical protein